MCVFVRPYLKSICLQCQSHEPRISGSGTIDAAVTKRTRSSIYHDYECECEILILLQFVTAPLVFDRYQYHGDHVRTITI